MSRGFHRLDSIGLKYFWGKSSDEFALLRSSSLSFRLVEDETRPFARDQFRSSKIISFQISRAPVRRERDTPFPPRRLSSPFAQNSSVRLCGEHLSSTGAGRLSTSRRDQSSRNVSSAPVALANVHSIRPGCRFDLRRHPRIRLSVRSADLSSSIDRPIEMF